MELSCLWSWLHDSMHLSKLIELYTKNEKKFWPILINIKSDYPLVHTTTLSILYALNYLILKADHLSTTIPILQAG